MGSAIHRSRKSKLLPNIFTTQCYSTVIDNSPRTLNVEPKPVIEIERPGTRSIQLNAGAQSAFCRR